MVLEIVAGFILSAEALNVNCGIFEAEEF